MKTGYNSLGWKYMIPEWATQEVFFAVDDDLNYLTCDSLKIGLKTWKKNLIGGVSPLLTYHGRST